MIYRYNLEAASNSHMGFDQITDALRRIDLWVTSASIEINAENGFPQKRTFKQDYPCFDCSTTMKREEKPKAWDECYSQMFGEKFEEE